MKSWALEVSFAERQNAKDRLRIFKQLPTLLGLKRGGLQLESCDASCSCVPFWHPTPRMKAEYEREREVG